MNGWSFQLVKIVDLSNTALNDLKWLKRTIPWLLHAKYEWNKNVMRTSSLIQTPNNNRTFIISQTGTQNRQKFVEQHDYKTVPARFRWQLRSQTVSRLLLRIIQTACKTAPINSGQLERKCGKQSGGARALLFSFHLQLHAEIKTPDHFRFLISNPRKESPTAL